MQDIRLPLRRGCGRRSSGTLYGVGWQFVIDGSGKRFVPTFSAQTVYKAPNNLHHATSQNRGNLYISYCSDVCCVPRGGTGVWKRKLRFLLSAFGWYYRKLQLCWVTRWIYRHHTDSTGSTAKLQTPHWHFRQHSESPDTTKYPSSTTANLQIQYRHFRPQRISRHNKEPSDTTANLQTLQWLFRHHNDLRSNLANNVGVGGGGKIYYEH